MELRLYLLCNRYEALVASHLEPEAFGAYMAVGNFRQTTGEEMFLEVDPAKAGEVIDLERARRTCVPHEDGTPRRSKYVTVYRALERLPVGAFGKLHLVTRDGRTLALSSKALNGSMPNGPHMYTELCPSGALVVSALAPREFIRLITDQSSPVSYPKVFLADLLIDRDSDGRLASYLPYPHPAHINECLRVVSQDGKPTKTVDRRPQLQSFYRTIRHGFYLGDAENVLYYPFPGKEELEEKHHLWWRSASLG